MTNAAAILLVARRELRLLARSRAMLGAAGILAASAWMPPLLMQLRAGRLGFSTLADALPLALAMEAVVLPLVALLAGTELVAGEMEDRSLVPIVTLPVSRRACLLGKCFGRAAALGTVHLAAFAGLGVAVFVARREDGWRDGLFLALAGLLMALACGAIGVALAAGGGGRVRSFATALATWVVLVFVLDAALLAAVVVLSPPPPASVGTHGHSELAAPSRGAPAIDPHARSAAPQPGEPLAAATALMAASPVSLFRLTMLQTSPGLRSRLGLALPRAPRGALLAAIGLGWLAWVALPLLVASRLFSRADL